MPMLIVLAITILDQFNSVYIWQDHTIIHTAEELQSFITARQAEINQQNLKVLKACVTQFTVTELLELFKDDKDKAFTRPKGVAKFYTPTPTALAS